MTREEIVMRYERAVKTQKRRTIVRSVLALLMFSFALLNYFDVAFFANAKLILFLVFFLFLIYSYLSGKRIGAAKDFKAIADFYINQDAKAQHLLKEKGIST